MKIGTLVTLTLLLLCGFAGAQNTFCSSGGNCTLTGNNIHKGTERFSGGIVATFSDPDFSITVFPDTQCYTFAAGVGGLPTSSGSCDGVGVLSSGTAQFQWMSDNAVAQNIKAGIQVGDIVDRSGSTQDWTNADTMLAPAWSSGVPFLAALGNHDWDALPGDTNPAFGVPANRLTTQYHTHIASVVSAKPYFGGSWSTAPDANYWIKFTNGTQNYGVITVEQCPRPGATTWAASVLAGNPTYKFIFATHQLVYWDNQFMTTASNQSCSSMSFTDSPQEGIDIWNNFISQHDDQIVLALSGHIGGGPDWGDVGRISPIGTHGNAVPNVVQNYQFSPTGGSGYFRIFKFHPSKASIDVQTYSAAAATYRTDPWNQFTVSYGSIPVTGVTSIKGDVAGTNAAFSGDVAARDMTAGTVNRYWKFNYGISQTDDGLSVQFRRSSTTQTTMASAPGTGLYALNYDSGGSSGFGNGSGSYPVGLPFEFSPSLQAVIMRSFAEPATGQFLFNSYNGTASAATPVDANYPLFRMGGKGYDGFDPLTNMREATNFGCFAAGTFSSTTHPTYCKIMTTAPGSVVEVNNQVWHEDGSTTVNKIQYGTDAFVSNAARPLWTPLTLGLGSSTTVYWTYTPSKAMTIEQFEFTLAATAFTCTTTYPEVGLWDNTASAWVFSQLLANATFYYSSTARSDSITAGHVLQLKNKTAGSGCTAGVQGSWSIQARMQ